MSALVQAASIPLSKRLSHEQIPKTGRILRVDSTSSAGVAADGNSWANAYPKLQDALAVANSGDEIWIARGIYYPDQYSTITANFAYQDSSFGGGCLTRIQVIQHLRMWLKEKYGRLGWGNGQLVK